MSGTSLIFLGCLVRGHQADHQTWQLVTRHCVAVVGPGLQHPALLAAGGVTGAWKATVAEAGPIGALATHWFETETGN